MAEEEVRTHPVEEKGWVGAVAWARAGNVSVPIAEKKQLMSVVSPALRSNVPNAGVP